MGAVIVIVRCGPSGEEVVALDRLLMSRARFLVADPILTPFGRGTMVGKRLHSLSGRGAFEETLQLGVTMTVFLSSVRVHVVNVRVMVDVLITVDG